MNSFARLVVIGLAVTCAHSRCCFAQQTRPAGDAAGPVVGAIRWDGWFGPRGVVGQAVHRTLGPDKWHYRLPFYAKVMGDERIEIDGTSQAVVDREIEYAAQAGLGYWAFVTYAKDDPLSLGLQRYLTSSLRTKIHFCLIAECLRWHDREFAARVVRLMLEPGYQRVAGGRPLLYVGFVDAEKLKKLGGAKGFRRVLDDVRAQVVAHGVPTPYLVLLDFNAAPGKRWADALGCDAISSYAMPTRESTEDYSELAGRAEAFWEACRETGASVVPIVAAGWDRRPRSERPLPWEKDQTPDEHIERYARSGTPAQIAEHVGHAVEWVRAHRARAAAQAILIYAWNEFDEGGWLAPTLSEGTARLDAIQRVLTRFRER